MLMYTHVSKHKKMIVPYLPHVVVSVVFSMVASSSFVGAMMVSSTEIKSVRSKCESMCVRGWRGGFPLVSSTWLTTGSLSTMLMALSELIFLNWKSSVLMTMHCNVFE